MLNRSSPKGTTRLCAHRLILSGHICKVKRNHHFPKFQNTKGTNVYHAIRISKYMLASRPQVSFPHFKVHSSFWTLLTCPKLLPVHGLPSPPLPILLITLLFSLCSFSLSSSHFFSFLALLLPLPLPGIVCLPCSVYFFLCSKIFQMALAILSHIYSKKPSS